MSDLEDLSHLSNEQRNLLYENNRQRLKEIDAEPIEAKNNDNFMQISKENWRALGLLNRENHLAFNLLWWMGERINRQNALMVSIDTLCRIDGKSRQTVSNCIRYLKEHKWVQVVKIGTANAYVINSAVMWQSYGDMRGSAFSATVIVNLSEQDNLFDKDTKLKHFPILLEGVDSNVGI